MYWSSLFDDYNKIIKYVHLDYNGDEVFLLLLSVKGAERGDDCHTIPVSSLCK
jgi:hypothetical protein